MIGSYDTPKKAVENECEFGDCKMPAIYQTYLCGCDFMKVCEKHIQLMFPEQREIDKIIEEGELEGLK